jgi:hypothetical protein
VPLPQSSGVLATRLRVERSGGFIGRTESAEVDLDDPAQADLRGLVADAGLDSAAAGSDEASKPDMYVYTFTLDDRDPVRVPEHRLTSSQSDLARRVLRSGGV